MDTVAAAQPEPDDFDSRLKAEADPSLAFAELMAAACMFGGCISGAEPEAEL